MGKIKDATFNGKSGTYSFGVYNLDTDFKEIGAVYIFTKRTVDASGHGTHEFLYIGETENLNDRIPNHDKWPCVKKHGVTHICVHVEEDADKRLDKETDLRNGHSTLCNDQ